MAPWAEIIDKLAGGGAAAGLKFGSNNAPVSDPPFKEPTRKQSLGFRPGSALFEDELTRRPAKEMPKRKTYAGVEVVELSKELLAARVGDVLLIANKSEAMKAGLTSMPPISEIETPRTHPLAGPGPRQGKSCLAIRSPGSGLT